jgi:hypothetical protein
MVNPIVKAGKNMKDGGFKSGAQISLIHVAVAPNRLLSRSVRPPVFEPRSLHLVESIGR